MTAGGRAKTLLRWSVSALALNLFWELAQLPLYTIYEDADWTTLAYAVAHCTAGDVLIALSSYLVAAITVSWRWPWTHPAGGLAAAILTGLSYTAFSEWLNVYVMANWAYRDAMPLVLGIGLSPLLQWLLLPPLQLAILRWIDKDQSAPHAAS